MSLIRNIEYSCLGFNRYMVECECFSNMILLTLKIGFNRYMVECECKWKRLYPGI